MYKVQPSYNIREDVKSEYCDIIATFWIREWKKNAKMYELHPNELLSRRIVIPTKMAMRKPAETSRHVKTGGINGGDLRRESAYVTNLPLH